MLTGYAANASPCAKECRAVSQRRRFDDERPRFISGMTWVYFEQMYSKQESPFAQPLKNGTQIPIWAFTKDMKSEFWGHSEIMVASFPLAPNVGAPALTDTFGWFWFRIWTKYV